MNPKVLKVDDKYYYFPTLSALAKYIGVTERTLLYWKKQGKDSAFNGLIKIEDYDPDKHTIDKVVIMDKNINFIVV